jgi:hypothetical protein
VYRLHHTPGIRQAADVVSGCCAGSRSGGWVKARAGSGATEQEHRPRAVPTERSEGARGRPRSGAEASAVAVRCVPDPALCERNGEALHSRQSQAVYSDSRGVER